MKNLRYIILAPLLFPSILLAGNLNFDLLKPQKDAQNLVKIPPSKRNLPLNLLSSYDIFEVDNKRESSKMAPPSPPLPSITPKEAWTRQGWDLELNIIWNEVRPNDGQIWYWDETERLYWRYLTPTQSTTPSLPSYQDEPQCSSRG